jgi:hypothetical protein
LTLERVAAWVGLLAAVLTIVVVLRRGRVA